MSRSKLRAPRQRPQKPSHPPVMMLVPHGGQTHPDAEWARRALVARYGWLPWQSVQGSQLVQQRNDLVARMLNQPGIEWGLLLDDDMVFEPDLLDRLLAVADPESRPIVAALTVGYRASDRALFPTLFALDEDGKLGHVVSWPPGELVEVERTGAACVLVHRSVFEKVRDHGFSVERPWFDLGDNGEFGGTGEDMEFFRRVRELEIPIVVDTSVCVDHLKTVRLSVADYVSQLGNGDSDGASG